MLIFSVLCAAIVGVAVANAEAPAQTYYLFVLNDPAPGLEDEFNRSYDQRHAQDVLISPLINPDHLDSQRDLVSKHQIRADAKIPNKYAIRFKLITRDIAKSLKRTC